MRHVICVGMALMDTVFGLDRLPDSPGKHFAHSFCETGGGIAANGAVTVCKLGGSAAVWGRLGDDALGQRIRTELETYGVDTGQLRAVAGCQSPLSTVLLDTAGERLLINYRDPNLYADPHGLSLAKLAKTDAVLADLRWPSASRAVLQMARERGIPALLDYDQSPEADSTDLLALASHVVFGREALAAYSACNDPSSGLHCAARATDAGVAVSLGEQGVLWLESGIVHHLPAFSIHAVDTLGAGDVFHGALALALAESQTFPEALGFASAAAALKCTRFGGRVGIPDRAELERFLQEQS